MENNYKIIDMDKYYRKGVFKHFSEDCKCSVSITYQLDVTDLVFKSKLTETKFYINFLYCLAKAMNSRDDYKSVYDWQTEQVRIYDKINITHYVFDKDTETCTPVYSEFWDDYSKFYELCSNDIEKAKLEGGYNLDSQNHINYFDASYISWINYQSLNIELPDGHLYFQPIVNWGRYKEENNRYLMPVTVRLNHAIADGYLVSMVFLTLEKVMADFTANN